MRWLLVERLRQFAPAVFGASATVHLVLIVAAVDRDLVPAAITNSLDALRSPQCAVHGSD